MYFLSFETSTKIFSLALSRDEKVLRYRNLKTASVLEDEILPAMDAMLRSARVPFSRIDAFGIGLGPGSFTSLRVGLATVKAFAMGSGKPVVGIPTLDIIAHGLAAEDCDEICVINDARRGKVYACLFDLKGPSLARKTEYLLTNLSDVLDRVHGRTLFAGDALGLYRREIERAYTATKNGVCKCLFAEEKKWYPQARVMAALAYGRLKNKESDNPAELLPIYLYPEDCQVTSVPKKQ